MEILSTSVGSSKWLCLGDFNAYKSVEDKQGGTNPNFKSMLDFNDCCIKCNLLEVKYCGPKFTWKNGRIHERLVLSQTLVGTHTSMKLTANI